MGLMMLCFVVYKQKPAYEMPISDWSSDGCSSDLRHGETVQDVGRGDDHPDRRADGQYGWIIDGQQARLARLQLFVGHDETVECKAALIGILVGPVPLLRGNLERHLRLRRPVHVVEQAERRYGDHH